MAASYRETIARFSVTAMAGDSSGWAKASACDRRDLDPVAGTAVLDKLFKLDVRLMW